MALHLVYSASEAVSRTNLRGWWLLWADQRWVLAVIMIAKLSGEIVIHFRWASMGEVTPKLCHPFPVSSKATTRLSGHARAVLFHNGTWGGWRETLRRMPKHRAPDGLLSDTRVAASMVDQTRSFCGQTFAVCGYPPLALFGRPRHLRQLGYLSPSHVPTSRKSRAVNQVIRSAPGSEARV
jgi:hypothetical protein